MRDAGERGDDAIGTEPAALPLGARLGRFRIERRLGWSGARHVYAAGDPGRNEKVAIKLGQAHRGLHGGTDSDEMALTLLRREADVLRHLDCAGIPRVKELNEHPPYLVFEMIDAVDLERALSMRAHAFTASDIAALCAELAEILTAIHIRGFLHGDIKPSNILLRGGGSPMLIDFGSARRLVAPDAEDRNGWSMTPGYAPPEFRRADAAIGPWSDVYSLGAVAYRIVTDRPPVPAESRLHGAAMPPAIELAGPSCPTALSAAIDWALELDPAARPFSAEEWRHAVRGAMAAGADAETPTLRIRRRLRPDSGSAGPAAEESRPRPRRWTRTSRAAAALAAIALAASAFLTGRDLYRLYENRVKQDWIVDAGGHGDERSIAAALARARDGAIIRIRPGVYQESLLIARPVELRGVAENGQQPTIAPASGPCITVTAAGRISNLLLRGANGAGGDEAPCIEIAAGKTAIENARVSAASGAGVLVRNGAELILVDSAVTESGGAGMLVAGGAKATVSGGAIRDSGRSGLIVRGGADLHLAGTHVTGAREAGLLVAEGAAAHLENAAIGESGASAVEISGGAHGTIVDSTVGRAAQAGIFVSDAGKAVIERTQIANNGFSGVIVAGGEVSLDAAVLEANSEHGVLILELASGTVANSRIVGNRGYGIAIQRGGTGELTSNVVERNQDPQVFDARRSDPTPPDRRRGGAS